MPNYNESEAAANPGKTYRRTRYIGIWNNTDRKAFVQILEADAAFIDGKKTNINEGAGGITEVIDLTDTQALSESFPLRNPEDDSLLGADTNVGQALAIIYAFCRHRQLKRDDQESQPPVAILPPIESDHA